MVNKIIYSKRNLIIFNRIINECYILLLLKKTAHSEEEINSNSVVAEQYCNMVNSLACLFVDTEQFDKAEPLHLDVLKLREKLIP